QFTEAKESHMLKHMQRYSSAEILKVKAEVTAQSDRVKQNLLLDEKLFDMKLLFDEVILAGSLGPETKAKADALIAHPVFATALEQGTKAKSKGYTAHYFYNCIHSNDHDALKY